MIADDFASYLHYPSTTDPSVAPPGQSTLYALVPVPHLGHAPVDGTIEGDRLPVRILDTLEKRLLSGLAVRIVTCHHYIRSDFASDLAAHQGIALSLAPTQTQSAWFRTRNRDDVIDNSHFFGAGTHPGAVVRCPKGHVATAPFPAQHR